VVSSFARCHRLTKTDEFSSVFGFRRAIRGQWLMLHYQPSQDAARGARIGLVVGKKQFKHAVDRNRVKRIVREQFRLRREALPAFDLVVRLHAKQAPLTGPALARDLNDLLDRLVRRCRKEEENG